MGLSHHNNKVKSSFRASDSTAGDYGTNPNAPTRAVKQASSVPQGVPPANPPPPKVNDTITIPKGGD